MSNSPEFNPSQPQDLLLANNNLIQTNPDEEQSQVLSSQEIETKIHFSRTSLMLLILRIILILLFVVLLTSETIHHQLLQSIEYNKMKLSSLIFISNDFASSFISISSLYILGSTEGIMLITSIIYVFIHPFIALKLVVTTSLACYVLQVFQMFYQRQRPFWINDNLNKHIIACPSGYGLPSSSVFITSFFYLDMVVVFVKSKRNESSNKKHHQQQQQPLSSSSSSFIQKQQSNICRSFILILIYIIIVSITSFILLINQINYLYQIVFSIALSSIMICVLIDFDTVIHNYLLKSLKNIYKVRKYKVKIFFYISFLVIIAYVLLQLVPEDLSLNTVEDNFRKFVANDKLTCSYADMQVMGAKATFLDSANIVGIIGSYWGVSLTIEKHIDIWDSGVRYSRVKKIFGVVVLNVLFVLVSMVNIDTFELTYVFLVVKYLVYYYLLMGIIPFIADTNCGEMCTRFIFDVEVQEGKVQRVNKEMPVKNQKLKKQNSALFGKSIFSNKYSRKADIHEQVKEAQPLFNSGNEHSVMSEMLIKEEEH